MTPTTFDHDTDLATLALARPAAARVLHRLGLDFCCGGRTSLGDACVLAGLEPGAVLEAIDEEAGSDADLPAPDALDVAGWIDLILDRFHAGHRAALPHLVEMARKVEAVHADKAACPHGLAAHLEEMTASMEEHMQKEEVVLFPMILAGRGHLAAMPIQCMEEEHRDHGKNLDRLRELADGYSAPDEACTTWRALYAGLAELDRELMLHVHSENNVVFPRALRG